MSELHIIGTTDEQTECDLCGRVELRCTVILADADGSEAGRYGTTCASRLIGTKITASDASRINRRRLLDMRMWADEAQLNRDGGFAALADKYMAKALALTINDAERARLAAN